MKKIKFLCLFCLSLLAWAGNAQPYEEYRVLKRELDGTYYTVNNSNFLYFTIDGEYNNVTLDYNVYDYQRNAVTASTPVTPGVLNKGDNRFMLKIGSLSTGYYVLEVLNQKKEKRVLRFYKP